jgi:AcrR family transcriptional regulator
MSKAVSTVLPANLQRLPDRGLGGRRKRRPERHDEILRVAVELFNAQTYAATSVEEIAAHVGVSATAVYRHFRNKQAILDTAALWINRELMTKLLDRLSTAQGAEARLDGLVDDLVETTVNDPNFVGLMVRELHSLSPETRRVCLQSRRDYVQRWCEALREATPGMTSAEALLRVNCVIALVSSLTTSRDAWPANTRQLVRDMSLAALRTRSTIRRPAAARKKSRSARR